MIRVYGLKNCDTCRKALKVLISAGHTPELVDIRAEADLGELLPRWLAALGPDALINKRSTTWRKLDEAARSSAPENLLMRHPTLIKRPVIETNDQIFVGWTAQIQAALL